MDRLPTVDKFLFCCDLKTGTLIIGAINLGCALLLGIFSLMGFGTMIFATIMVNTSDDQKFSDTLANYGKTEDQGQADKSMAVANAALIFSMIMMAIMCIICVGYVIVASMLIHGARTSKPGLLMPWIILTIVSLFYDVIRIIGFLIALDFGHLGGSIVGMVIGIYLLICITSFRKQLLEEQAPRPIPLMKA